MDSLSISSLKCVVLARELWIMHNTFAHMYTRTCDNVTLISFWIMVIDANGWLWMIFKCLTMLCERWRVSEYILNILGCILLLALPPPSPFHHHLYLYAHALTNLSVVFFWKNVWNALVILSTYMYGASDHWLTDVPLSDSNWSVELEGIGILWGVDEWPWCVDSSLFLVISRNILCLTI